MDLGGAIFLVILIGFGVLAYVAIKRGDASSPDGDAMDRWHDRSDAAGFDGPNFDGGND